MLNRIHNKWPIFIGHFMLFFYLFLSFASSSSFQKDIKYMSLKYNDVNVRAGPSKNFPILHKYKIQSMPILVLGKYDNWYKIKDIQNNVGWINNHLLSKARTVITLNEKNFIYKSKKISNSYPIFKADKNVVLKLLKCNKDICKVEVKNKGEGWIRKSDIWGWDESIL